MAKLESSEGTSSSIGGRPIPASTQLLAVAWLRWRIFVNNSFRRIDSKGKILSLVILILIRVFVWLILAAMGIGPAIASGTLSWAAVAHHRPDGLITVLTGIAVFWQFLAINGITITATLSSFDPSSLSRFPVPFGRYLLMRTLFGLLTPSTVVGCLSLLAAMIGVGVADPSLAFPAVIVLSAYALVNIFFTRMLEAWFERWMASRRFREIFGVFWMLIFVGIQFINVHHSTGHVHGNLAMNLLHRVASYLHWLPPGFAANAIILKTHPFTSICYFAALAAWAMLFLAVYAIRIHKQFLGEYLSEDVGTSAVAKKSSLRTGLRADVSAQTSTESNQTYFSPVIAACLRKEWLLFRGNTRQITGMLAALFFVFILHREAVGNSQYFLPGAIGYVLLGLLASVYNIFGVDGAGVQLYLFAPVRMRDVILAKNIVSISMMLVEVVLAWSIIVAISRVPIPIYAQVSAALWTVFVIVVNLSLGTLRSIQSPQRYVPGQTQRLRNASASRGSQLFVLAGFFGSILLQVPVIFLSAHFHQPWLGAFVFSILATVAVVVYGVMLRNAEKLVLHYRDRFAEELCKA